MGNEKLAAKHYEPYGPEWEKEMNNFPKKQLISMLGAAYKKKQHAEKLMGLLEGVHYGYSKAIGRSDYAAKADWQSYRKEHGI